MKSRSEKTILWKATLEEAKPHEIYPEYVYRMLVWWRDDTSSPSRTVLLFNETLRRAGLLNTDAAEEWVRDQLQALETWAAFTKAVALEGRFTAPGNTDPAY